ncbi:MAG: hypothetical protein GY943_06960 [Chloroflexi bacterium]|nr:hypothetical protein [Chloroflexota bacterium]
MKHIVCFVLRKSLWVGLLLLTLGCTTPALPTQTAVTPTTPPTTLRIGIATSATAVSDLVTLPYSQHNPQAILQFTIANTDTLLADLAAGQLDTILVHHLPLDHQFWFNPIALDGLAIIVHPDNPITDLSRSEVQAIFNGRLTQFPNSNTPITLITRENGAGTRTIFNQRLMAEQRISINAQLVAGNEAMLATVMADETAVGYTAMSAINNVKPVPIDGISATPSETASQNYPLSSPLYFVSTEEPQNELRFFLAWLQSNEGQTVLGEKYGRVR